MHTKVKIISRIECPDHVHEPGQVTEVGNAMAAKWIAAGDAVAIGAQAETAAPPRPETAVRRSGKK